ncbi:MAG: acylneuraminate cytidylyltransferase family protein [Vicingaceae bacterium]
MTKPKCICIIPARGGSKRIPRKNILPLNGKPLMAYSIEAAIHAKVFEKVVVSTEDQEIKEIALQYGAEVDDRPKEMAGDFVTKVQVVKEMIERKQLEKEYDYVAAVLPTCPFKTASDISEAFKKITSQDQLDFLIGVTEYDFPIEFALEANENESNKKVRMLDPSGYQNTRSQNKTRKYHPNGAIYIASMKGFVEKGTFFNEEMLFHYMPALRSFDIDYPYQFEMAEIIAQKKLYE